MFSVMTLLAKISSKIALLCIYDFDKRVQEIEPRGACVLRVTSEEDVKNRDQVLDVR